MYAQKRHRDEARAKRRSGPASTTASPPPPFGTTPGPARPASSGEPRAN
jgi:hypothetical protein